jgi:putative endonuclease
VSKEHLYLGRSGEETACALLKKNGYKILVRNYKNRLGEIDIIACDRDTICFIEVKSRHSNKFGLPQEAIFASKQRKISRVALSYLKENNLFDKIARFDVVSVMYSGEKPRSDLIKNAFELDSGFTY